MSDLKKNLATLEGWKISNNEDSIKCIYNFKNFVEAFSWMTEISLTIEKNNHHPEWKNTYNVVEVILQTHDAKTITNKDFLLAKHMNNVFKRYETVLSPYEG